MKNLILLILALVLTACCSTKQVVENTTQEETVGVIAESETTQIVEVKVETETVTETESGDIKQDNSPKNDNSVEVSLGTDGTVDENGISETVETIALEAFNHEVFNTLLGKHVSKNGNVNYKGFKSDIKLLREYIKTLSKFMPEENWTKNDKLAYWINAYNAMTIDLIIRNYPTKSIKDIKDPWDQRLWKLGDKWYHLNQIEHQILRKMDEPRIHFGIVCASFSCPKLQNEAFTASKLEGQLTSATKEFLSDSNRNNISKNSIKLSKIFKWFSKDFKQNGSLIDFLNQYSEVQISSNAKKSYKDYNWSLNE